MENTNTPQNPVTILPATSTASVEAQIVGAIKSLSKELKKIKSKKSGIDATTALSTAAKKKLGELVKDFDKSIKDSPLNWIPAKEKLFTTIGIEYTFLKRKQSKVPEEQIVKKIIKLSDKRQAWNKKVHQDGRNVIEFASPVHSDWEDLLRVYRNTAAIAKKVGLVVKRHDEGGGSGHIHMGIPKHWTTDFRLRFLKLLYLDIASRPYINWIFNEPIDDRNASSLLTTREGVKFLMKLKESTYIDLNGLNHVGGGKSYAARYDSDYDTVEFRCFDMVENEQMLEEYVEFINAYFRFIASAVKRNYYSMDCAINYYRLDHTSLDKFRDKKTVVEDFNKLLREIGLNPVKYRKYISKNYDVRIFLSKRGDVKMDYDSLSTIDFSSLKKQRDEDDLDIEPASYDDCDYDNRIRNLNSILPERSSRGMLQAILTPNRELVFQRLNTNTAATSTKSGNITKALERTERYNFGTGEINCSFNANNTEERAQDAEVLETEEEVETEESPIGDMEEVTGNNSQTFSISEISENTVKYIIGPSLTTNIMGVPIANSSSDKFLIVTKNPDNSLTFKYFSKDGELTPVEDASVENNPGSPDTEASAQSEQPRALSNVERLTNELSGTISRFRETGNVEEARRGLQTLLNHINVNSELNDSF